MSSICAVSLVSLVRLRDTPNRGQADFRRASPRRPLSGSLSHQPRLQPSPTSPNNSIVPLPRKHFPNDLERCLLQSPTQSSTAASSSEKPRRRTPEQRTRGVRSLYVSGLPKGGSTICLTVAEDEPVTSALRRTEPVTQKSPTSGGR
jgi:hypothetical protein